MAWREVRPIGGPFEVIHSLASKLAEHAARIAGIIALVENPDAMEISEDVMGRAIEIAEFYLAEGVRILNSARLGRIEKGTAAPDMDDRDGN
jgi:hypothetical protein